MQRARIDALVAAAARRSTGVEIASRRTDPNVLGLRPALSGDDALTGSSFDTWVGGVKADAVFDALTLTLAFTQAGDGANWNAPYGW